MGQDKSLINFHGKPQREYLFEMLKNICAEVYTSCKQSDEVPNALQPLPDRFTIESPLNGILSAFELNPHVAWLTVPVDMPGVDLKTLEYLISKRSSNHIATCFFDSEGKEPEPLLTLWESAASSLAKQFYKDGHISPRDFLRQATVNIISVPNNRALRNINSPKELRDFLDESL